MRFFRDGYNFGIVSSALSTFVLMFDDILSKNYSQLLFNSRYLKDKYETIPTVNQSLQEYFDIFYEYRISFNAELFCYHSNDVYQLHRSRFIACADRRLQQQLEFVIELLEYPIAR